jgi:HlyD family secretion protein
MTNRATSLQTAVIPLMLALALAGCGQRKDKPFTGYMEAQLLLVGAERAGRISNLSVEEGGTVKAGEPLFEIDDRESRAQADQAGAQVVQAGAQLADTLAPIQRPADLAVLQQVVRQAQAAATLSQRDFERTSALVGRGFVSKARLDAARSARDGDVAALAQARSRITQGEQAARAGQIQAAEAALAQARAAQRGADTSLSRFRVSAPASGSVEQVYFRAGEVVSIGQPVVALLPPERLRVRFFVSEARLAEAKVGRTVAVSCDSCPAGLTARIAFVSRDAEFTPPVILSRGDRERLVYLIEAIPLGDTGRLAAGQPIDVTFK